MSTPHYRCQIQVGEVEVASRAAAPLTSLRTLEAASDK